MPNSVDSTDLQSCTCYRPMFSAWMNTFKVKVKIKLTLEQATRTQRGSIAYSFFNLGTRWGWVVNASPQSLYLRERLGTHCVGGWVGSRAGLDG